MKRAFLLLGLVVAVGASLASPAVAADAAPAATERLQALDQQVLAALNRVRVDRGLRPLVISDALQGAAVAHSRAMLEKGFFAHDSPSGVPFVARVRGFYRSAGYNSWAVGENLIYNTEEITADIAIAAWLASPGHRANMLSPAWREVGIGSLYAASAGGPFSGDPTWVVTMDFGARSGTVAKPKAAPKPAVRKAAKSAAETRATKAKNAIVKQKATPSKRDTRTAPKAPAKQAAKAKPVDRVLPRPSRAPEDETDDPADAADESVAVPDEDGDDVVDPTDESADDEFPLEP